jgi:hypothetical protein
MYKKEQLFRVLTGTVLLGCQVKARSWLSNHGLAAEHPPFGTLKTAQDRGAQEARSRAGLPMSSATPYGRDICAARVGFQTEVDRHSSKTPGGRNVANGTK